MQQNIFSGINAKPLASISLGGFDPVHDAAIFGLSSTTNFKTTYSLTGKGFDLLDSLLGRAWDVKPFRLDREDYHFKFVNERVFRRKSSFALKFSFCYCEASFPLSSDNYRDRCKTLS